jgi:hypothetical protein
LVRPILIALVATAIAGSLAGGQGYDRDDKILDPEIDPNPFDPRAELRNYFRANLRGGWWANEPTYGLSMFRVLLHAPKGQRGRHHDPRRPICADLRYGRARVMACTPVLGFAARLNFIGWMSKLVGEPPAITSLRTGFCPRLFIRRVPGT